MRRLLGQRAATNNFSVRSLHARMSWQDCRGMHIYIHIMHQSTRHGGRAWPSSHTPSSHLCGAASIIMPPPPCSHGCSCSTPARLQKQQKSAHAALFRFKFVDEGSDDEVSCVLHPHYCRSFRCVSRLTAHMPQSVSTHTHTPCSRFSPHTYTHPPKTTHLMTCDTSLTCDTPNPQQVSTS